jgi:hypothetical protein
MADENNKRPYEDLEMGSDVTVITKGQYQLVDVAGGIKIPPLTEVTLPLSNFVMNELVKGSLALAGKDGAPKAENDSISDVEELKYLDKATQSAEVEKQLAPRAAKGDEDSQNSSTGNEALTSTSAKSPRKARAEATEE